MFYYQLQNPNNSRPLHQKLDEDGHISISHLEKKDKKRHLATKTTCGSQI